MVFYTGIGGDIIKWLKALLIPLTILVVFCSTIVSYAWDNPYSLYGQGNCVKLTYDAMEKFWPVTPDIPGDWDAYQWTRLVGQEIDGYRILQTSDPRPGDVFILGRSNKHPRGHVGMVVAVWWNLDPDTGSKQTNYTVLESNMYANAQDYPLELNGCRYRAESYSAEYLRDATFIRCSQNN